MASGSGSGKRLDGEASSAGCTLCSKIGLKPFTKDNIFSYYIPLHGVVSYGALAVNVMNPPLVASVVGSKKDLTNLLLFSAACGGAVYMYGRPHLVKVPPGRRSLYAAVGAGLWTMGSVLGWAVLKSLFHSSNNGVATVLGLASGAAFVKVTVDYFNELDNASPKK